MKRILHPTDFSDCARRAQDEAVSLVRDLGGELILLHVAVEGTLFNEGLFGLVDPQKVYDAQRKWAEGALEELASALRLGGVTVRWIVRSGVPVTEIVDVASMERCDLVVMGTHGRSGVDRMLLGSVADRVIRLAPCPVLTVRLATEEG